MSPIHFQIKSHPSWITLSSQSGPLIWCKFLKIGKIILRLPEQWVCSLYFSTSYRQKRRHSRQLKPNWRPGYSGREIRDPSPTHNHHEIIPWMIQNLLLQLIIMIIIILIIINLKSIKNIIPPTITSPKA